MNAKRLILFTLCVLIAGGAVGYLVFNFTSDRSAQRELQQMQNMTIPTQPTTETTVPPTETTTAPTTEPTTEPPTEEPTTEEPTTEPKEPFVSPIDFVSLQRTNIDIYAWIDIEGTEMSFPILQHSTINDYYLDHTANGAYGWPGSIYTHCRVSKSFRDFNSIIYGHNMTTGTMFAHLEDYRDETFLQEHRDITIYTPYSTLHYKVFAAVVYNKYVIDVLYDFDKEEERVAFLNSLDETRNLNNHILDDIPVGPDDRIITLSTCSSGDHEHRYLVLAVLTDVEE